MQKQKQKRAIPLWDCSFFDYTSSCITLLFGIFLESSWELLEIFLKSSWERCFFDRFFEKCKMFLKFFKLPLDLVG